VLLRLISYNAFEITSDHVRRKLFDRPLDVLSTKLSIYHCARVAISEL
jgi:hypothetical protein